jgi:hypothetical protein
LKTFHWVLIFVAVGLVGFGVYWFAFRKKKVATPVPVTKPAAAQSTGNQILSFAENEGKKALSSFVGDFLK